MVTKSKWKCHLQNLHSHTVFSDGGNTPEEMILDAMSKGFDSIGFTEHSYISWIDDRWLMPDRIPEYLALLDELKEKYRGQFSVFKGIELDACSEVPKEKFDYIIGNVHYRPMWDGDYMEYCHHQVYTAKKFMHYYDFDIMEYARDYFEHYLSNFDRTHIDIAGHFDALTKYDNTYPDLFHFDFKEYRDLALQALHATYEKCEIFEVNSGLMGRGQKYVPSPEPFLLKELKNLGAKVCVTTDCHKTEFVDLCFDDVLELLLSIGFESVAVLTDHGFVEEKII